jgi:DNA-directed RNA polymerase omega subunit
VSNQSKPADVSRFEFVVTAGARAKQLLKGATPRVESSGKTASIAMREVASGLVRKIEPGDASAE